MKKTYDCKTCTYNLTLTERDFIKLRSVVTSFLKSEFKALSLHPSSVSEGSIDFCLDFLSDCYSRRCIK